MSPTGINRSAAPGEFSRLPAEGGKILVKIIHTWHQLETLGHYSLMEFKGFKNRRGTWHQAKDIRYITLMDVIRYHSSMCVIRLQLLTLRNTSPSSEIEMPHAQTLHLNKGIQRQLHSNFQPPVHESIWFRGMKGRTPSLHRKCHKDHNHNRHRLVSRRLIPDHS